jgi:hypothetical protein
MHSHFLILLKDAVIFNAFVFVLPKWKKEREIKGDRTLNPLEIILEGESSNHKDNPMLSLSDIRSSNPWSEH